MNDRYVLAARLTAGMVVDVLSRRHGWPTNDALSRLAKTKVYEQLVNPDTSLWLDNPNDIADMADCEMTGQAIPLEMYYK